MNAPLRTLVVGLGNMGLSHARAYAANPGFEIVGLVNRSPVDLPKPLENLTIETDYAAALKRLQPDLVSINTYTDTHAEYAISAMQAGAHVFVEKPLAATLEDAEKVVALAQKTGRKLIVGYILRHHPSWQRLIAEAQLLGGPYVFRMNLNQQSSGATWATHKMLMQTTSPIVDCGVHYLDVMCQIAPGHPTQVRAMGARLSEEVAPHMYNYGHLQVLFSDGSMGWYEAGWGPMMSETAFFVKDVISPNGSVSIVMDEAKTRSDDVDSHTRTSRLRIHYAQTDPATGAFVKPDQLIDMADEPGHLQLCEREQAFVQKAISDDLDLGAHMAEAVQSLAIALAADRSVKTGQPVKLAQL